MVSASNLPRWRGFNLLAMFNVRWRARFSEDDFRIMRDWGFDWARLPMDYRCWIRDGDPFKIDESALERVDEAVEFGRRYGVHVCMNFHRAPGYTVARPAEPLSVWTDEEARRACAGHWRTFARRYAGIPSERISFNLFNEPWVVGHCGFTLARYREVVKLLLDAVWEEGPDRLVICDGYKWAREPVGELTDLGVAQSSRAYEPLRLTHYKAQWVGGEDWPEPQWPGIFEGRRWDKDALREYWRPWKELADSGVGVHCGEGGAHNTVPHGVFLAWLDDALAVLDEYGIGWALWHLRGSFGVLDSERQDVEYEDFEGHRLDRKLLGLLQRH